jgi:hypothetical protein
MKPQVSRGGTPLRRSVLALSFALLAGCSSQAPFVKAHIVTKGMPSAAPALPLTVAVTSFVDATGDKRPEPDRCYIYSTSYLNALEDSRLFQGVYAEVEAPQSELRVEGTIRDSDVNESNLWFVTWVVTGVATFGLFPGIGALLGLPYATHNGSIELETRLVARSTGAIVATYHTEWDDKLLLNIYNDAKAKNDFYNNPKVAMQAVMDDQMRQIAADREKIRAAVPPAAPPKSSMTATPPAEPPPPVPPPR